jgi:hypothetical protein
LHESNGLSQQFQFLGPWPWPSPQRLDRFPAHLLRETGTLASQRASAGLRKIGKCYEGLPISGDRSRIDAGERRTADIFNFIESGIQRTRGTYLLTERVWFAGWKKQSV